MRMVYTFVFTLAVIVNSIESSLQGDIHEVRRREKLPVRRVDQPSPDQHVLELGLQADGNLNTQRNRGSPSSARLQSSDRTSPERPPIRGRSRSPQGWPPSFTVLGYALGELGYIRLSPRTNPSLQFEFRRYIIPAGKPIRVRAEHGGFVPVPNREHIVLSAANGEIFAILEYSGVLRGIYTTNRNHSRVKINMTSGAVDNMTSDEVRDCPVGERHPIFPYSFIKVVTKYNSLQSELNQSPDRTYPEEPPLRGRSSSPQGRPPSFEVLGYTLGELGYIRLSPRTNPTLQFEFRRYIIPADKPIRVRAGHSGYTPVPTREHIVLSTSDGDICAILEYSGVLRGIYRTNSRHSRVKINMMSGAVNNMTSEEARDCPLGGAHPIFPHNFIKVVTKYDSLQSQSNPDSKRIPVSSSSARQYSPDLISPEEWPLIGRPPSHEVLGYALEQLGHIRLIPQTNQNRRFEFRRYVFPLQKRIQLLVKKGKYTPVSNREYIVLSTAYGEVFAILEYTGILRGIYKTHQNHHRIKINMTNGAVYHMTADEIQECKVGVDNPIFPHLFKAVFANSNSLETVYH